MISRVIPREPENDCYRGLAFYIGAANHEQEKLLGCWHSGCVSEEFDLAIREVEVTQAQNVRSKREKTYHLIVSIRPEDEDKVSLEVWKEIESIFTKALGFDEHQRHCGVHKNTNNQHMHVAYNMIHPQTFKRYEPFRDYFRRDKACRKLEQRYCLIVDVQERECGQDIQQENKEEGIPHGRNGRYYEHIPEPYPGPAQALSQNRLRRLSECHLAHSQGGREGQSENFLSPDACFDRRASDGVRRSAAGHERSIGDKARTVEAHTGQQSFGTYALGHKQEILQALQAAATWEDMHEAFALYDMEIKPHANGLVVKDRHGKHAIKASALDRNLSLKKLEAHLGPYVPPSRIYTEKEHYTAQPLHRGPERGLLYAEYQAGIEQRKEALNAIAEELVRSETAIKNRWAAERHSAERNHIIRTCDKIPLIRKFIAREREELKKIRADAAAKRSKVREDVPYYHWAGFLQGKARDGNEMALAILRSRGEEVAPEQQSNQTELAAKAMKEAIQAVRKRRWDERTEIYEKKHLLHQHVLGLQAASFMHQLIEEEEILTSTTSALRGFTWDVDAKGVVLFRLPSGGLVRDNGKEISFSAFDPVARDAAAKLGNLKFRRGCHIEGNAIVKDKIKKQEIER